MINLPRHVFIKALVRDQKGATALEYALIVALIVVAFIGIASDVGQTLFTVLDTTVNCMDGTCDN